MVWKVIKSKFWSFFWFFLLPAVISIFVEVMLVRSNVFIEIAPWRLLLILAVAAFGLLSFKNHLPFWHDSDIEEIAIKQKTRKEAGILVRQLTRFLGKNTGREDDDEPDDAVDIVKRELDKLKKALSANEFKKIRDAVERVREVKLPKGAIPSHNSALELIKIFGTAIVLAILLRSFVVEPFKIPSASMIPTLQIGDHIFVTKFSYGLTMPFFSKKRFFKKIPGRGDVMVFRPPHDPEKDFIKRVIGRPGDILELRDSVLYINQVRIPRCEIGLVEYEDRDQETSAWRERKGVLFVERLGKVYYLVMNDPYASSWGPEMVDEGTVYVIGDNRDNSFDSRSWGGVPFDNIKGEGMIIWWSNGPGPSLRYDRMGHRIMGKPVLKLSPQMEERLNSCMDELKDEKTIENM